MMHPYATNSTERQTVPLFIAAIAFAVAWAVSAALRRYMIELPFWVEIPSTAGLYGLGYECFKHRLWKLKFLSSLGWVETPHIAGEWSGIVTTSFDEHATQHDISIVIKQNWTDLSVRLKSRYSGSYSVIGAITIDSAQDLLSYEYINEPLPGAVDTMHTHRGTARLKISADRQRLEGEYYSGRDRKNEGILILKKP